MVLTRRAVPDNGEAAKAPETKGKLRIENGSIIVGSF
jgi:hypothetical protein